MPESLPAVFAQLVNDNVGPFEKSLVIDLGGTTLDVGVIVGQFEDVSAIHGNSSIGVSMVTQATLSALRMASSDTSPMVADGPVGIRVQRLEGGNRGRVDAQLLAQRTGCQPGLTGHHQRTEYAQAYFLGQGSEGGGGREAARRKADGPRCPPLPHPCRFR